MKIALDAMGADRGPRVLIHGALDAVKEWDGFEVLLVGREKHLTRLLRRFGEHNNPRLTVVHAADVAGMDEKPAAAFKRKDTSVNVAARLVREGKADALVSAGNTGATKAAALFGMGRLKGIKRPALATLFPTNDKPTLLLDVGATLENKPEFLYQYAVMGNAYARDVLGRKKPRVAVLSIGEEEGKGTESVVETCNLLRNSHLNFCGNAEGRDIPKGTFDVVVCDGFTGNSMLKISEGTATLLFELLSNELRATPLQAILARLLKPAFRRFKKKLDWAEWGGAPLLGVNGACIVGHGSSCNRAVKNAIRAGVEIVRANVNKHIIAELESLESLQRGAGSAADLAVERAAAAE
jgi:glycerol-3-phosphate acyltransferase PlsX